MHSDHSSAEGVFIDALPYYDNDLASQPNLKALVDSEIARELKAISPLKPGLDPRLEPERPLFKDHPGLLAEYERVVAAKASDALDTSRYKLPAPPNDRASQAEWQAALNNAKAQLEHQKTRQLNLSLLQTYGPNAWRVHNYLTEATVKQYEQAAEALQEQVTEVNRGRKNAQQHAGNQLSSLDNRWTELISSVLQLELANAAMEGEIEELRRKEADLSAS